MNIIKDIVNEIFSSSKKSIDVMQYFGLEYTNNSMVIHKYINYIKTNVVITINNEIFLELSYKNYIEHINVLKYYFYKIIYFMYHLINCNISRHIRFRFLNNREFLGVSNMGNTSSLILYHNIVENYKCISINFKKENKP